MRAKRAGASDFDGCADQLIARDDTRDYVRCMGFFGGQLAGGGHQVQGKQVAAGAADFAEALCTAPAGNNAERRAFVGEDCFGRCDADVASERKIQAAAHAIAADCGDDGFAALRERAHYALAKFGEADRFRSVESSDFCDFGAGREGFLGARDYERLGTRISREFIERREQFAE